MGHLASQQKRKMQNFAIFKNSETNMFVWTRGVVDGNVNEMQSKGVSI